MPADLIIYVIIVLALLVWLRNTLGTRPGDEPPRPNPLSRQSEDTSDNTSVKAADNTKQGGEDEAAETSNVDMAGDNNIHVAPDVESEIQNIASADRNFDIKQFIGGAQDAFVMIVEAFAKGDRETLKPLLQDEVYAAFDEAISQRENRGETQETEIQAIRKVEVTNARLVDDMAYITVRITAQEVSVTRDSDGEVIAGNPDRLYDMTDRWTFGRNVKSRNPVWFLYETNDDVEEEHDSVNIPDAGGDS